MKKALFKILIVNALLTVLALTCFLIGEKMSGTLLSQQAAERWTGESDGAFTQMSCFLSETDHLSINDIYSFRQKLETSFVDASLQKPEHGSLYRDAWSTFGKLHVVGDYGSGDAYVTAVGGDFFFFHPLKLCSGSYITESDVMDDRVVLDEELAWMLFGGSELEGMTVTINEIPYVVAGVVEREQDFASSAAYTGGAGMFMSFAAYSRIADASADCYEVVLPQPVEGFAEAEMEKDFPIGSGEIINNSGRFSRSNLWSIIRSFGLRSMHLTSVVYPYWENAARYLSDVCALLFALALLFAVCPMITLFIALMILLIRLKDYLSEHLPEWVTAGVDKSRDRRYQKRIGAHEKK